MVLLAGPWQGHTPTLSARGLNHVRGPHSSAHPRLTSPGAAAAPALSRAGSHSLCSCGRQGPWADGICSLKRYLSFHSLRASRAIKGHARRQVHKCSIETDVMHTQGPGLAVNCQEHPPQRAGGPVHRLAAELGGLGWGEALCSLKVKARWDPAQVSPEMPRQA